MSRKNVLAAALVFVVGGCAGEGTGGTQDAVGDSDALEHGEVHADGQCLPEEECNGIDDDCDGLVDEGFDKMTDVENCGACGYACELPNAAPECREGVCRIEACHDGFLDIDGDPYNGCEYSCTSEVTSETSVDGSCSDGIDNDCDGKADNGDPDCASCVPESCNGEDDDCDTLVDEEFDLRSDPLNCGACGSVCFHRPHAHPVCILGECGIECDAGYADLDEDPLDGCEGICTPGSDLTESQCNGIDDDCDGRLDEGYEPYTCGNGGCEADSVCDHGEQACLPLEPASAFDILCDGVDNDCDGETDEDFEPVSCVGACREGARCESGSEICGPRDEITDATCDGADGDCDGEVDEDYVPYRCGTGVCENLSACEDGVESCVPLPQAAPDDASCDDLDDDCDGFIDEDYEPYVCGLGVCQGISECNNGTEECDSETPPAPSDTLCNGLDDDCDGSVDEDYVAVTCGDGVLCGDSSSCVDGVETPCQQVPQGTRCGLCKLCDAGGTCVNVLDREDPNDDCPDDGANSCDRDGTCDGLGACRYYDEGTSCLGGTCIGICSYSGHCCVLSLYTIYPPGPYCPTPGLCVN